VRWRRPAFQARAVIECGERVAVCFNAPVVELVREHDERAHPSLRRLGPDILSPDFELDEVVRRARAIPAGEPVGEVLLDQTVVAGIGNIYRCESLFDRRVDPWTPIGELGDDDLRQLVDRAKEMLEQGTEARFRSRVHGRHGRPCPRCGTTIKARRSGPQARVVFFCPECQPGSKDGS
jgi:endonuclease-8